VRLKITKQLLESFLKELGAAATSEGRCFLTGGATAVMYGWRDSTIDVDVKFEPEPDGVFIAIPGLKDRLKVNVELASPDQFIPPIQDWQEKSKFIATYGLISFYHYNFVAQALAKLERGHKQDITDVKMMLIHKLITTKQILEGLEQIRSGLIRYPAISADAFVAFVEEFVEHVQV